MSANDPAKPLSTALERDIRPWLYAACDLFLAILYAYVLMVLIPSRHDWMRWFSWLIVLAPLVMAGSMLVRRPWAWWAAALSTGVLLVAALVLLTLILLSAAFLGGVYGSLGRAASTFALIGAALVVEFMGILPALQLKYLMTRAGRRCFGKEPIWR
jgi:hypothetical protein